MGGKSHQKNHDTHFDSQIVDLVCEIMGNGTMVVETPNESILVKLLEMRGTPIAIESTVRDIEADWQNSSWMAPKVSTYKPRK